MKVELILEDRRGPSVEATATMLPGETEVIISDRLASELGIVILDAYRGLWCLRDELGSKTRVSVRPEYWR